MRGDGLKSLPEQIADRIGDEIVTGAYQPGQRIQEQHVAAALGVSRGPVREALRILEKDGLVVIHPRRGAQVTHLTVDEVKEIFDIRMVLSALAAQLIIERDDAATLARLKEMIAALKSIAAEDGDTEVYARQAYALSLFLATASGSARLEAMMHALARQTLRYSQLGLSTPERRRRSARLWTRLLQAMRAGDREETEALSRRLVTESRDKIIELLEAEEPAAGKRRAAG
ncbi:MAG: GntR family transcriptional regulator [Azospirillaceae bacterium]